MEKNRMKVLVFEPGQEPHVEIINKNESAYRELVGGPITAKPLDDKTVIVYNDTKVEEKARPNRWIGGAIISGTFFLVSSDDGEKLSDIKPYQMQYYNAVYGKPHEISKEEYSTHISLSDNVIGKDEMFVNNLNLGFGKNEPNFKAIVESLKTADKIEAKELLKRMHDMFAKTFGTYDVDNLTGDEEFIHLPAICRSRDTGELHIGLVYVDLNASGEHWGTDFITEKGFLSFESTQRNDPNFVYLKDIGSYDYWYTPIYGNDIHTDIEDAPEDVMELINYVRGNEEQTQGMSMDSM